MSSSVGCRDMGGSVGGRDMKSMSRHRFASSEVAT